MAANMHTDYESPPAVQAKRAAQRGAEDDVTALPAVWKSLAIDRSKRGELVSQFVTGVTTMVETGALQPGVRLPSVRGLSRVLGMSTFSVAEAYDRLVASGLILARRGAGYFVNGTRPRAGISAPPPVTSQDIDALMPELYTPGSHLLPVSAGWLPGSWHNLEWMQGVERQAIRVSPRRIQGYGHPLGLPELRELVAHRLATSGLLQVAADQIVLTRGATHAFDLVLRALVRPGDAVLMEEPGYPPLAGLIEQHGCCLLRVPRDTNGIDHQELSRLCEEHAPKVFFVQTVLQNPLGTSLSTCAAYQLVATAEKYGFHLVDNDVCRDLAPAGAPSLAALDGLRRVIRIDSTSKTLSPQFRVGSICASGELIRELVRLKMATGLTSSEHEERIVRQALNSSEYRRVVARLQTRLTLAIDGGIKLLRDCGLTPLAVPEGGFFISAGVAPELATGTGRQSGSTVARLAAQAGLLLLPGHLFMGNGPADPAWFRFNVAWVEQPRLHEFLKTITR